MHPWHRLLAKSITPLLFAVLAVAPLGAQTPVSENSNPPLKHLNLEQLGQVEVTTASKEPVEARRTPAAIYIITSEAIRRSGATSIADALRLAPGVEVSRISSSQWAIGIRGLSSNFSKSVLVLIDGRSTYTPLFAGTYWDVQDLVLSDIDRIEVIRGPGGIIWGPNAVNGVINIITKSSEDTQGVIAGVIAGGVDRAGGAVRYGGRASDNMTYRVYGKGFARGAEFHPAGDNFDDWHQERGGFRTDWKRAADTITVQGDLYRGDSPQEFGTNWVDNSTSGGNLLGRWRRNFANGSDIYLQTYFDRTVRIGTQLGETRNTWDVDSLYHFKAGNHNDVSLGGGLRFSPSRFIQKQPGVNLVPNSLTDHIHTAFLQDEIHVLKDSITFTVGAKLQHNNYSGFDIQPTARVLWTPDPKQSVWAAVTRAVTTPSRIEEDFILDGFAPGVEIQVVGNPKFKSESLVGYEGGYRRLFGKKLSIDLDIFHNNYSDLQSFGATEASIAATPAPPHLLLTIPYTNAIYGSTNGVEIAPTWDITSWYRLAGSYSYVGLNMNANAPTSDISATGSVRTYEGSDPHHQVQIQSTINLPGGFEFDQFYRHASSLPAQKVPAYQTVDARLGWNPKGPFQISIVGQNLLQPHHYEWGTGDPSQPLIGIKRTAYIKIVFVK